MKKLGVAVIGTGFWGKNHARVYNELEMAELKAVCDINEERAKSVAHQFDAKDYTNTERMLRNEEIDAVSVCTWSTSLAKEALKSLKAGKHVLVEKPMAANTQQAKQLIKTAEAANRGNRADHKISRTIHGTRKTTSADRRGDRERGGAQSEIASRAGIRTHHCAG